ncbi:MAG: glycosyltransferase family 2 protein [Cyanobacteriota bacterium]|nr:glycosyltransferase family 2 protein [Cyanobacteriota bacterium]
MRRRLRVVRVARAGALTLELQRVQYPMQVRELWLMKLPGWDAWRRIRRRLQQPLAGHLPERPEELWRAYNKLLAAQANQHSLVPYCRWMETVEPHYVESLPSISSATHPRFHIHPAGSPPHNAPVGTWVVLLHSSSRLSDWALPAMAEAIRQCPQAALFYGDEDQLSPGGERHSPQFKPAWNRELCWCDPGYSHCWVVAAELWNRWLDHELPASSEPGWQSVVLGLVSQLKGEEERIRHVPLVLSHRRVDCQTESLPAADLETVLRRHLGPGSPRVVCNRAHHRGYRLLWPLPLETLLSVVIPTRDRPELLEACLASIDRHTPGCDLEILVADNGSVEPAMLALLERFQSASRPERRQVVIPTPGPFNYSAINNLAIRSSGGSVILLLNNDVEFLQKGWGRALASNALRPGIGCVGAQLLYPDRRVQHGGVILGVGGIAGHAHQDFAANAAGYQGRLQLSQELSAVTGACLAISRENWQQLGGLDERNLAVNYNDVDLCLRARQLGLRNLYLPHVRALHHESKSRGRPEGEAYRQWRREWAVMKRRWGDMLLADPAYSPHLNLEAADWTLSLRRGAPLVR